MAEDAMEWGDESDCKDQDMDYKVVRYNKRKKRAAWVIDLIMSKHTIKNGIWEMKLMKKQKKEKSK